MTNQKCRAMTLARKSEKQGFWKSAKIICRWWITISLFAFGLPISAQTFTFSTIAGYPGIGNLDGVGSGAQFALPEGVAVDSSGNVYVADAHGNTIRRVTPAGVVTTLAGLAGAQGSAGSADGTGSAARFNTPSGIAIDGSGILYVGDTGNHTIRMVTMAGVVTTLAGQPGIIGSSDGTGSGAQFKGPTGVAVDNLTNVYVADTGNHTIRRVSPSGVVITMSGQPGAAGSKDGTGGSAQFNRPNGVAVYGSGSVYVADSGNNTIRKLTPEGVVTTFAGQATVRGYNDGPAGRALFNDPYGVAVDSSGNVFVGDTQEDVIRMITPAGLVSTLAGHPGRGYADGTGGAAEFNFPNGVAVDGSGTVYVADSENFAIRKISSGAVVTSLAGQAGGGQGSADGTNTTARFGGPIGITTDSSNNVFVVDLGFYTVRKITPAGVVTTLAGKPGVGGSSDGTNASARFTQPVGVGVDNSNNLYVADNANGTIRKITPAGVVTTLAGLASHFGTNDGVGSAARFSGSQGVAVDSFGNVFVADNNSSTIRKITPGGTVTTFAGAPLSRGTNDGTGNVARFGSPSGLAVDSANNLYVSDLNDTIRKITPAGVVTTLAGLAGNAGSADGTNSTARFYAPYGIAVDIAGNLYVGDSANNTIRRITPAGVVTTIAGQARYFGSADLTGTAARFWSPRELAFDRSGNLYVADLGNAAIRKGVPTAATPSGPQLLISSLPQQVILAWPASDTNYNLENNHNLAVTNGWAAVLPAPSNINGTNYLTNPISPGSVFYRLHSQ